MGPAPIVATYGSEFANFAASGGVDLTLWSASGAVGVTATHPTNPDIIYVGAVNGGVWKTENATYSRADGIDNDADGRVDKTDLDEVPSWQPLTDDFPTPIGSLTFDPIDSTSETLWAGNARYSSLSTEGVNRGGLLRTTDGGETWEELGRSVFSNADVDSIVPTEIVSTSGQLILVATSAGTFRSVDSGSGWTRVLQGRSTGLVRDPTDSHRFYSAIPGQGIFRSDDCAGDLTACGDNWTAVNTGIASWAVSRIGLAATSAGTGSVFAAMVTNGVTAVYELAGTASSWDAINFPAGVTAIAGATSAIRHFAMTADPNEQHRVLVSGFRGIAVGDGQTDTWWTMTSVLPKSRAGVVSTNGWYHDDIRSLAMTLGGELLVTSDGGVHRIVNPFNNSTRFVESINGNLATVEVNSPSSLAYDSLNDLVVLGTQDNGTISQTSSSNAVFQELTSGDGNSTAVGIEGNVAYHYVFSNNWKGGNRTRYDGQTIQSERINWRASGNPAAGSGLTRGNDQKLKSNTYAPGFPFVVNRVEPSRLLLGTSNGLYESSDRGDTVTDITPGDIDRRVTALAYGGTRNGVNEPERIYAGLGNQLWLRTENNGKFRNTSYIAGTVTDIAMNPTDSHEVYVLSDNRDVWRSVDEGDAWTNLTAGANLSTIRSIEFAVVGGTSILLAATDRGVMRRISPGIGANNTSWSQFGIGLPNVIAEAVVYDPTDKVLLVGTIGRGVWKVEDADLVLPFVSTLTIGGDRTNDGQLDVPQRNDVIRIARNALFDDRIDIFVNHLGGQAEYTVEYAAAQRIRINTKTGDDFVQVDYLPPGTPLDVFGGPGRDTLTTTSTSVFSDVTFNGGDDADWFLLTPTPNADLFVVGEKPPSRAVTGDELRVIADTRSLSIQPGLIDGDGTVFVTGFRPIRYVSTEVVHGGERAWRSDLFEPNDSSDRAFDLLQGSQTHTDLTIDKPGDDDWYKWSASNSGTMVTRLLFNHDLGDLDLYLYDSALGLLDRSISTTDDEQIAFNVTSNSTYFVRVVGDRDATHPNYHLKLDWPFGVPRDVNESNDSVTESTTLPPGDQVIDGLSIHRRGEFLSDQDWYAWTASASGMLRVDAKFQHLLGNIDLNLFNATHTELASSASLTDNESVSAGVIAGDTYYLLVTGLNGSTNPSYELTIDGPAVLPDVLETDPNNTMRDATELGTGLQAAHSLSVDSQEDEDWFKWTATGPSGTLRVYLTFEHRRGDLDLEVFDANGRLLGASASANDNELITLSAMEGQTYFVRVFGYRQAVSENYSITFDWQNPVPLDAYEPNDRFAQATAIGSGDHRYSGLSVHEQTEFFSNDDYFRWTASADGLLTVELDFLNAIGDLDLQLYDATQTLLANSTSTSNREALRWNVQGGQTFFFRVYGFNGSTSPAYNLGIDGPDILRDLFEPNGRRVDAYDLGMGDHVYAGLSLDSDHDTDWYTWTASASGLLTVQASFDRGLGDIELELHDANGQWVRASQGQGDVETVRQNTSPGERYYVRVFSPVDVPMRSYTLTIDGPDIAADEFERNDNFSEAVDLGRADRTLSRLTIHEPGNEDWFRWTARARGTLVVDTQFRNQLGDLDLELYNSDQGLLGSSLSMTSEERISLPVEAGDTYFVRVWGARTQYVPKVLRGTPATIESGALSSNYQLDVRLREEGVDAEIVPVAPNPRSAAIDAIQFIFDGPASGFTIADLKLARTTDQTVTVSLTQATLSTADQRAWNLNDLAAATIDSGIYDLTLPQGAMGGSVLHTARTRWINRPGDANGDNQFDSADLLKVFQVGEYEDEVFGNSSWSEGDWNDDGEFDSSDLILALQSGGFLAAATPAQPEHLPGLTLPMRRDVLPSIAVEVVFAD